jgi:hypothetical protein
VERPLGYRFLLFLLTAGSPDSPLNVSEDVPQLGLGTVTIPTVLGPA